MRYTGLLIIFAIFSCAGVLQAQSYKYCGLEFLPDQFKLVDSENYLVEIWQEQALVPEANLGIWFVSKLTQDSSRLKLIATEKLSYYLQSCPKTLEPVIELKLISEFLKRSDQESFDWIRFFRRNKLNLELLKTTLTSLAWQDQITQIRSYNQHEIIASAVFELYLIDSQWIIAEIPKLFFFLQPKLAERALDNLKAYIDNSDTVAIAVFNSKLKKDPAHYFAAIEKTASLALDLFDMLKQMHSEGPVDCSDIRSLDHENPQLKQIIYPLYKKVIIENLKKLAKESSDNKQSLAIKFSDCITRLDPKRISPEIFQATSDLVLDLERLQIVALLNDNAKTTIQLLVQSEDNLKLKYEQLLKEQQAVIQKTVKVDTEEKQTDPGKTPILNYFMLILLIGVFCLIFRRTNFTKFLAIFAKEESSKEPEVSQETEFVRHKNFVRVDSHRTQNVDMSEYGLALKFFSLPLDATLKDIKSAYRQAVKSCHPDLNPYQTELEKKQFIELTSRYEKIIELRTTLNLD